MTALVETTVRRLLIDGRDVPALAATLEVEHAHIDTSVAVDLRPDRSWEHADAAGHYHAWSADGTLPTLTARTRHMPCSGHAWGDDDDDCEGYDETYRVCSICDAEVEPAMIDVGPTYRSDPGRMEWRIVVTAGPGFPLLDRGRLVSVQFGGQFGIGSPSNGSISPDGRIEWTIYGAGPLGHRHACTCPDLDTTSLAERSQGKRSTRKGLDPACPQHGRTT